jgi:DNA-binding MarR family transcriptional regulator
MTDLERRVLMAIRRIVHGVDRHSKQVERASGITLPQLVVLTAIRRLGEVTSSKISEAASLSPATVTTILDKLEARGLVERYRNVQDRRVVHSRLTPAGAKLLEAAPPFLHERFVSRFAKLDDARKAAIVQAIEDVAEMMGVPAAAETPLAPELPLEAGPVDVPPPAPAKVA